MALSDDEGVPAVDVPEELLVSGLLGYLTPNSVAFSAPLYRFVVIHRLHAGPLSVMSMNDFDSFVRACVQRMSPTILRNSFSVGQDDRILERQWQMEFYRTATTLVTRLHSVSPDVGRVFGCDGLVDFYVNGNLNWAFELLREGQKSKEHAERFGSDGIYSKIPISRS